MIYRPLVALVNWKLIALKRKPEPHRQKDR
jgi:hypothetical protein